jgi:hypothetical protein
VVLTPKAHNTTPARNLRAAFGGLPLDGGKKIEMFYHSKVETSPSTLLLKKTWDGCFGVVNTSHDVGPYLDSRALFHRNDDDFG